MSRDKEALDAYSEVVISAAERVGPTVVRIDTERGQRIVGPYLTPVRSGLGSGFIFQSDGLILTNAHVVANTDRIQVTLVDKRVFSASLVHIEPREDLAVLRINGARDLAVAELSDDPLKPGQLVIAIGNPIGLGWSVTAGVVSALGRTLDIPDGRGELKNLIQTQTPINPGNSGGPLVSSSGKVVGITTAIVAGIQGIGFAIPVDSVYSFLTRVSSERARRGVAMGVSVQSIPLTPALAQSLRVRQQWGLAILGVMPGSAAEQGGLRPQDVILGADGVTVQEPRELAGLVQRHKPGDKFVVVFVRNQEPQVRQVTLILS
jgi:serine protease Do